MSNSNNNTPEENYNSIFLEIEKHNSKTEELYKVLQESNVNVGYKKNELTNKNMFKKDFTDANKTEMYNAIKKYFDENYEQNTKLRKSYFDKIVELDKIHTDQNKDMKELNSEYKRLIQESDTGTKKSLNERIAIKKLKKYNHLYVVSFIIQVLALCLMVLVTVNMMPKYTCFVLVIILMVGLIIYILYNLYLKNLNEDDNTTDGIIIPVKDVNQYKSVCAPDVKQKNKKIDELQNKLDKVLVGTKESCPKV
tara:strand:- start:380 stop:1135 length:756 start_codon:yes stop_codon:yes gene_type:complete